MLAMRAHLARPDDGRMEPRQHVLGPVTVFRIGFGAMQLPGPGVLGPPRDRAAAIAVLRRAADLGVDHIDTAQYYGPAVANELIRAALHPYPAGLALVSKVGARRDAAGGVLRYDQPAELRQGIEDNLRSLDADRLAVANLRLMDGAPPGQLFDDQLAAMVQARDDGLIGGIGLSNVTRDHLRHALSVTDIACVQNLMNLAQRESMPVLEECHARGIAFVPFFPLGSGFARGNPVVASPGGHGHRRAPGLHARPGRAGLAPRPAARGAADPRHLLDQPPRGEPGRRQRRAGRRGPRAARLADEFARSAPSVAPGRTRAVT